MACILSLVSLLNPNQGCGVGFFFFWRIGQLSQKRPLVGHLTLPCPSQDTHHYLTLNCSLTRSFLKKKVTSNQSTPQFLSLKSITMNNYHWFNGGIGTTDWTDWQVLIISVMIVRTFFVKVRTFSPSKIRQKLRQKVYSLEVQWQCALVSFHGGLVSSQWDLFLLRWRRRINDRLLQVLRQDLVQRRRHVIRSSRGAVVALKVFAFFTCAWTWR